MAEERQSLETCGDSRLIRVLLVADCATARHAIQSVLECASDIDVCAATGQVWAAPELAQAHRPDVVVMDGDLDPYGGMELTRALVAACPAMQVVVVARREERRSVDEAIVGGAHAVVSQAQGPAALAMAIRSVAAGGYYFAEETWRYLLGASAGLGDERPAAHGMPGARDLARSCRRRAGMVEVTKRAMQV